MKLGIMETLSAAQLDKHAHIVQVTPFLNKSQCSVSLAHPNQPQQLFLVFSSKMPSHSKISNSMREQREARQNEQTQPVYVLPPKRKRQISDNASFVG